MDLRLPSRCVFLCRGPSPSPPVHLLPHVLQPLLRPALFRLVSVYSSVSARSLQSRAVGDHGEGTRDRGGSDEVREGVGISSAVNRRKLSFGSVTLRENVKVAFILGRG